MQAQLLHRVAVPAENFEPLTCSRLPIPRPREGEILIRVSCCGVCHTELDEIEGRTPPAVLPMIPGHQVVGRVAETGTAAHRFKIGDRVGVAWIFSACGSCSRCRGGLENLCPQFRATGRDAPGGYAEYMTVSEQFAYALPDTLTDHETAPLLCAGAVGYRALKLTSLENGRILGLTGFGGSGHLVLKMVKYRYPDSPVFVFARSATERAFALELGADWAGDTAEKPPEPPAAIIDTTPAWRPVISALSHLAPGGRLVINAIRKEGADRDELSGLDYAAHLWMEKEIKTVANVCRRDVEEFLLMAATLRLKPDVGLYPLTEANRALQDLKSGHLRGAKVLVME